VNLEQFKNWWCQEQDALNGIAETLLRRLGMDANFAGDILHRVFLNVLGGQHFEKLDAKQLRAYVLRSLWHAAVAVYRQRRRQQPLSDADSVPAGGPPCASEAELADCQEAVAQALGRANLSDKQLRAVEAYLTERDRSAAAKRAGANLGSEGTAGSYDYDLSRAKRKMSRAFDPVLADWRGEVNTGIFLDILITALRDELECRERTAR